MTERCSIRRSLAMLVAIAAAAQPLVATGLEINRLMDEPTARAMVSRFGYGATPSALSAAMSQTPGQYLTHAIRDPSRLPPSVTDQIAALPVSEPLDVVWTRLGPGGTGRDRALDDEARKALQREENQFASAAIQARLLTMANGDNPGHEALLSFWLNHFSIFAPKNFDKLLAWDYVRSIEQAMPSDSFEALLRASFFHPAMQVYLDNAQSTATTSIAAEKAAERGKRLGINENLARELLELHTLGVNAGYAQNDVQELARIITGAGVYSPRMNDAGLARAGALRRGLFLFDPRRHDYGAKLFLGERFPAGQGISEIDRAIHLLATHPATAKRIAEKLAQRFLADQPPTQVVEAMTAGFLRSGGKISATLLPLLESTAFATSLTQPTKFKEPLDYILSVARAVCGDTPINNRLILAATALDMGEAPMMHGTPDGYGSRETDWLSPAAMTKRVRLAMGIASERVPLARSDDHRIGRLRAFDDSSKVNLLRGEPCTVDFPTVDRMVGPVSSETKTAAAALLLRERAGLLLASPEFMRR
ncbi:DUF1800 domain-containing protein [Propionivibrio sp.]|uniref:DUF1800 domain-containing protein n=1 Tax=Propionivibrio sp. TaxID=2212460 RepID=UPI0025F6A2CC|nr:DUF1800 domain-containing protein [Propionivibrio sp.]MBK7354508.1 DUF1800 domain-containing protein [Propionivibrio sp.]MBK8401877.1 DUF1800 domain-containing protein [Propionivibrio sp.]MBK8745595.1 DUF1800 domain-containing protein [Propionivibrio sp.]MBK8895573.1 DUF1800 domain-containing protein [Propionivibrio sp.]MBL0206784.1 DUF1800 domain-containing protein [Propionivibrio sp.]